MTKDYKKVTNFKTVGWAYLPNKEKQAAFTLAEVLITLAIIGVVAVLTLPTLMANITQRQYDTAATTFERKLGEALKVMNSEMTLSGYTTTESFVNELSKHIKIINTCKSNELEKCMPKEATLKILDLDNGGVMTSDTLKLSEYKTSKELGGEYYGTEVMGLQFANGVSALIAYNPKASQDPYSNQIVNITGAATKNNCYVSLGTDAISMIYDVNGNGKPNTTMKDVRGINSFNRATLFKLDGKYWGQSFATKPITYSECEKIKGNLGVQYCAETYQKAGEKRDDDHWLYAVKTCGGVNKLPTLANLAKLSDYLYDQDFGTINANKYYRGESDTIFADRTDFTLIPNMQFNSTKNAAIGFPAPWFNVWSGRETSASDAYDRVFYAAASTYSSGGRYDSWLRGVCVGE